MPSRSGLMRPGRVGGGWLKRTSRTCFSAIPQDKLCERSRNASVDQAVLTLLRAMLRAGVRKAGRCGGEVTGAPQGGPASPLLCNIYLHRLDRVWTRAGTGCWCATAMTWW